MDKKLISSIVIVILVVGAFIFFSSLSNTEDKMAEATPVREKSMQGNIEITPIEHATMVLTWGGKVIYTDPVGGAKAFAGEPKPDLILLTHNHPDHFDAETLKAVSKDKTVIIAPMSVANVMPDTVPGTLLVIKNGQKTTAKTNERVNLQGFAIEAVPMYNLPAKSDSPHKKGDGNGYVIEAGGKRVYVSGDTSSTPEMRNLKNIDIAFVSMNLPYTMSVDEAAAGVLAFKPKHVYPYHYRGTDGLSDISKFKSLVNIGNPGIDVVLLNWYPTK